MKALLLDQVLEAYKTFCSLSRRNQITGVHIGHRWLIPKATLDAMLQQTTAPQGT